MSLFQDSFTNLFWDGEVADVSPDADGDYYKITDAQADHNYLQTRLADILLAISGDQSSSAQIIYGGVVSDAGSGRINISECVCITVDTNGKKRLVYIPSLSNLSLPSGWNDNRNIWVQARYDYRLGTLTRGHRLGGAVYHYQLKDTYMGDSNGYVSTSTDDLFSSSAPSSGIAILGKFKMNSATFTDCGTDSDGRSPIFMNKIKKEVIDIDKTLTGFKKYIVRKPVELTLPSSADIGDTIEIETDEMVTIKQSLSTQAIGYKGLYCSSVGTGGEVFLPPKSKVKMTYKGREKILTDVATLVTTVTTSGTILTVSYNGKYVVVVKPSSSDFMSFLIYKIENEVSTLLYTFYGTTTPSHAHLNLCEAEFSFDGKYLVIAEGVSDGTEYGGPSTARIYKREGDTFTLLTTLNSLDHASSVAFDRSGTYLFLYGEKCVVSPYCKAYKRTGDTFTDVTSFPFLSSAASSAYTASAFSPDKSFFAAAYKNGVDAFLYIFRFVMSSAQYYRGVNNFSVSASTIARLEFNEASDELLVFLAAGSIHRYTFKGGDWVLDSSCFWALSSGSLLSSLDKRRRYLLYIYYVSPSFTLRLLRKRGVYIFENTVFLLSSVEKRKPVLTYDGDYFFINAESNVNLYRLTEEVTDYWEVVELLSPEIEEEGMAFLFQ